MIRALFLFILIAFSSALCSQQPADVVLNLTYIDQWDSDINDWVRNQRLDYSYDENLNQTEGICYYQPDAQTNDWIAYWRFVSAFDGDGNRTEIYYYYWDPQSNDWIRNSRHFYTYDGYGNRTVTEKQFWNPQTNSWIPTSRETGTYNANRLRTGGYYYYWDQETHDWVNYRRFTTSYDNSGNPLQDTYYNWDNGSGTWVVDRRVYSSFDNNGNRTEFESQYFDPVSDAWRHNLLVNEAYDGNGNLTEGSYYRFDTQINDWLGRRRYVYTYDEDGNRTEEVNYRWDQNTHNWANESRSLISIDENGNPGEETHYRWDSQSRSWRYLKRVENSWSDTPDISPNCGPCLDETFTAEADTLYDNSCDEDYDNSADCRKLIRVPDADYINLVFTEFDIEQGYDFVRVYDGPTAGDALLGEFTGSSLPDMVTSTGGSMLIRFTSDYSVTGSGWTAEYTSGEGPVCANETLLTESGMVDDNSGDQDYMINANCQKLIEPDDVLDITLTFTEFNLENGNDYVRVYDGPTTDDELLGEFTGTSMPGPITSSGGSMLIQFTSNSSVNASGWAATYTSTPSPCGPCVDETYSEPEGSFSDNSCGEDYDNFSDCRKLIQVPDADYINLFFTEFNIEQGYDFVRVYDGPTTDDLLLGEFTGTSLPDMLTSSGNILLVHFVSDYSITSSGWRAEYVSENTSSVCIDETFTAESGVVDDNSGDLDYGSNADCQKLIAPGDVLNITLRFTEFALENGNDFVRIYDGTTTGDALLGQFTGTSLPEPVTSSGGSMLIRFTSNSSVNASGWEASYTSTPIPDAPCLDQTFTAPVGTFSDNSGNEDYMNLADCRKLIQIPDADYINLTFTAFDLDEGNDFVRVYDGPTTGDALLAEFTGSSLPAMVTSTGGTMLVQFTSDQNVTRSGWRAEYVSGKIASVCTNETFTSESGMIDDNSGAQDYEINADCQKLIELDDVMNITLTFSEFDLEEGNDYVRVYDGATTTAELLGEFTGTSLPDPITSSGGSMLIHFTSNGSVNASGWEASYTSTPLSFGSCLDETFTDPAGSFSDNSYESDYENLTDCRKLIQVPGADFINLLFTAFDLEEGHDYVRVYDGSSTGDALLGEFTGTTMPAMLTSTGGSMLVQFTSDQSGTGSGWTAEYVSGKLTTFCSDETFISKSGIVDDNSGPMDYENYADCRKLIEVPGADYISLVFTEFSLDEGYDFVRIHDGSTTEDKLLGEFTGKTLPGPVTSSGSTMLIHFTSNGNINGPGWVASYKGITEGDTTATGIAITKGPVRQPILVYPNPVVDHVTIEMPENAEISSIELFDPYGRKLRIMDDINSGSVTLQRGDLQTGMYILRIHATDIYNRQIFIW